MIKLNKDTRTVRQTEADFEFNDGDGQLQTEKIRVLYYSPTTQETKEIEEEMRKRQGDKSKLIAWYHTDTLIRRLHSLPDLVDDNEKPHKITLEFLDSLSGKNIEAINDAITDDLTAGKSQPAK
jgi:hypothetical protein